MRSFKVGILGATGMVGQQYLKLLQKHPWFAITYLAASETSANKSFAEAIKKREYIPLDLPQSLANLKVGLVGEYATAKHQCDFIFSALTKESAHEHEPHYAAAGLPVISNASAFRQTDDVPSLIPEINSSHLSIIKKQQELRNWNRGFLITKPNCSIQSFLTPIHALNQVYPIKRLIISTLQAVSGAGKASVEAMGIQDNVIPYIAGEEEKSELEPLKILGHVKDGKIIANSKICISAHCNRVPISDGHLACISVEFEKKPERNHILNLWDSFKGPPQDLALPSAPKKAITYFDAKDRPQPRKDRMGDKGMTISVGRLRPCPVFDFRFTCLSHNTIRGAAGGAILTAELLIKHAYIT